MGLTFRENTGSALTYNQMDSNFRYFTSSFTNSGSITATGFIGSFSGSHSGSFDGTFSGSFSGSFEGDGTNLTGILTASYSLNNFQEVLDNGSSATISDVFDLTVNENITINSPSDTATLTGDEAKLSGSNNTTIVGNSVNITGKTNLVGAFTSSGDISSSGTVQGARIIGSTIRPVTGSTSNPANSYNIQGDEYYIVAERDLGGAYIDLPNPPPYTGSEYVVVRINSSGPLTVSRNGGPTINGASTISVPTGLYSQVKCTFSGDEWFAVVMSGSL
jgi:hypothetical protein